MIRILGILLLLKFCSSSSNKSYAVLNFLNTSEILKRFGEREPESGEPMHIPIYDYFKNRPKSVIVEKRSPSDGPFYNLIVKICDIIMYKFKTHKIPEYIRILSNSLRGLGQDLLKTLVRLVRKRLRRLSLYNGAYLKKKKLSYFFKIIREEQPRRIDFFQSMNALFSIGWVNKLDEYVWMLEDYGRGWKTDIEYETRRLCSDIVFGRLYKQRRRTREKILNKLMSAYREYLADRVRVKYDIGELDE